MTWLEAMYTKAAALIAADTTTFAAGENLEVALIAAPFTPSQVTPTLPIDAPVNAGLLSAVQVDTVDVTQDPSNGDILIDCKPVAGGWRWESSSVFVGPSETIYGAILINIDTPLILGSFLFDDPITITAAGQVVTIDTAEIRMRLSTPFLQ